MIKRFANIMVCAAMLGLTACGSAVSAAENDEGKLSVVCTTFPGYDWTGEILGSHREEVQLTYLLDNGADLHNYQPSAADMVKISGCDVFVYVGGESEHWVADALKEASNKDMQVVKMLDVPGLDAKEEEVKEGMEAEEEDGEEEEPEYDEHVWLSVKNAEMISGSIADALAAADPDNSADYKANYESYKAKLAELDEKFTAAVEGAQNKPVIFGDRFPFRYLCDDYGLDYYAAFVGCSAETEASFETVAFLAEKVDETGTDTLFTIENSDGKIAQAIISNTEKKDQKTAVLNSLQSVDAEDADNGASYITLMEQNCETLKEALK
ncbi:metal ABC transporter substrate-binding protein [Ruminococcus sp.]|uniref:metal ABC transporter substrate-binding protein n=1 Tax=Ruminococcus sp. TaxID=41978 RepID=UPI0025F8DDBD|nr:metal ABC transporter substrate-binding protein [Ruminococcus sp.]MBQ8966675.1 zinc ABC transporter substrate-binding protein [Ruminococcus sp.]